MSNKVLIIGAGGVGRVVAYKCAQHRDVFGEIMLASRTKKNAMPSLKPFTKPMVVAK